MWRANRGRQVKLSVVSPLRGRALPAPRISQVGDLAVHEYTTWDVSRSTLLLKRGFDLVIALLGLVLLTPFLPQIAPAIKLATPGPVFFSQGRAAPGGPGAAARRPGPFRHAHPARGPGRSGIR